MWRLWESDRRRESLSAIPDEVVDELVVHGTPEQCAAPIQRYVANGVQVPLIMPLPIGLSTHEAAVRLAPASVVPILKSPLTPAR